MSQPEMRYLPIPIKLQVPKKQDEALISELTMRPPKTDDIILAESQTSTAYEKDVLLYANLTGTTEALVRSLEYFDYLKLDQAFELFLLPLSEHLGRHASLLQEPQGEQALEKLPDTPSTNSTGG